MLSVAHSRAVMLYVTQTRPVLVLPLKQTLRLVFYTTIQLLGTMCTQQTVPSISSFEVAVVHQCQPLLHRARLQQALFPPLYSQL